MLQDKGARGRPAIVVITAKAPIAGVAKTRLAPALPADHAAALHRALLSDTIRLVRSLGDVDVALICPRGHGGALAELVDEGIEVVEQSGDGLAAALTEVFERFTGPDGRRVIALDSDSPHLPAHVLRGAVAALEKTDLVVGPTQDGGYYLVGGRGSHPELFTTRALGTSDALTALLQQAHTLGLTCMLCTECFDVDRPEDLELMRVQLRADASRAPETAALLAQWDEPPA